MAGYVLHLSTEENITLSSATVKRLIAGGSGDAALLYLAILHARGAADSGKLARELKWDETRLRAAEQALYEMKLVGAPEKKEEAPLPPPQQLSEPPEYTREDIARKLEGDGRFACLLREVEHKLGPLSTPSVKKLLGLYENLGLPADVVYTLVNYCIAKKEQQFGEGRLPNMREIEKEGYVWARKELFSIEKASEAYDRTILHCHEFRWPYCNGILKRWHEKGLHTLAEVRAENAKEQSKPKKNTTGGNAWMKEYLNQ